MVGILCSSASWNVPRVQAVSTHPAKAMLRSAGIKKNDPEHSPKMTLTPVSGGTLRFPLIGAPGTLDPAQINLVNDVAIPLQIFEGLTQLDQTGEVIPAIASSWSSPDATVWTFNLRHDVYFHNGRQLNANDFVFSWNRAKTAGGPLAYLFDDISSFLALDDFTFVVTLTDPYASFLSQLSNPIFSVIASEAAASIETNPIGTGPFRFVSRTTSKITLQKSLNYYDTPAYLDTIEFKLYSDINTAWADLQASKLSLSPIPAGQWGNVETDPNVITGQIMLMQAYGFDTLAFPDVTVRQALQRAINRAAIASDPAVWPYSSLPVANGVVSPGKGSYDSSDIDIPYDPTDALTMLASAGWTDTNADGILDDGAGTNLSVAVQDSTNPASHARAAAIANDLSDIGGTGVGAQVTLTTDQNAATFERMGWISDYPAPDNDLHPFETGGAYATRLNYSSTTFDDHVSLGRETLDETARNAEFHAADVQLVSTDAAVLPLHYGEMTPVLKKPNVYDLVFTSYPNIALLKYAWLELPACVPTLVSPQADAILDNGRNDGLDGEVWDFDWSSCANATKYHLYVYHTGASSPVTDQIVTTGSSYHRASGGYVIESNRFDWAWKVQAYVDGQWGNWSELRSFDVEPLNTDLPNINPPSTPLLNLPANGSLTKDYTPRLDWSASAPTPDHYELQLSTDANFITPLANESIAGSTSEFTIPSDLDPNAKYFWRVHAVNANNESSAWSATWNFRTAILPAVLLSPTDTELLDHRRPSLDWDDVTGATGYKLVISKNENLSDPLKSVSTVGSSFTLTTDLPAKTKLYRRVQAAGPNGPSLWSDTWSFTTGNPPSVPVLASPALNALVKDYTPLLNWGNATLPANTTFKHYQVQVDDNSDFSSPVIDSTTTPADISDSDFTPISDLDHNTKFFWRVRAVNTVDAIDNFSAWSPARYFRVIVDTPELLLPADDTTVGSRKPTFDWTDVANNTGYMIQVSASPSFATLLINTSVAVNVSTFTPAANLPAGKTLYWRVRTKSPNGPSAWSAVFNFTTP